MTTITPSLVVLDLPKSALCGINLLSFTSTPRFHGIKNLPHGWHFFFCAATASFSLRHGVWFFVSDSSEISSNIIIKRWNAEHEELESADGIEAMRWRGNLSAMWRDGMSPYRQNATDRINSSENTNAQENLDWHALTEHLTAPLLSRIIGGTFNDWAIDSASSAKCDQDHIPGLSSKEATTEEERELHFLPVDLKRTWREGAVGRERTDAAKDRSWALGDVIENHCHDGNEFEILGEFEFAFLMTLILANYSCLEQWKRILELFCTSVEAVHARSSLYAAFLVVLRLQLQHCSDVEGGLFDLTEEGSGLLKKLLVRLKGTLDDTVDSDDSVRVQFFELERYLRLQHGWELSTAYVRKGMLELEDGEMVEMETNDFGEDDETGEYAPVVVELSDAQQVLAAEADRVR